MTLEQIRCALGWCSLINIGLLTSWAVMILCAHDWIYRIHSRWFKLSHEQFDTVHYAGIAFFKIIVFVFNIVPYIALWIVG
jgi:Family of unknown function (DUF6868)